MNVDRGSVAFALVAGTLIIALWTALLLMGRVALASRPIAHGFHLTAEGLTALTLIAAGLSALRQSPRARSLFFFASGLLLIASLGMLVVYFIAGDPVFSIAGALVTCLTLFFVLHHRPVLRDFVRLALGTVLYLQLTALGNVLQAGDTITAAYVVISLAVTLPVTLALLRPGG